MPDRCSVDTCNEAAVARVGAQLFCRSHFLAMSYRRLEAISTEIHTPSFHRNQVHAAGEFLEECMRQAADIASAPVAPRNLEKAQVLDVLLWASELHGRLRRGARVPAGMPVLLRSERPGHLWEERTETRLLSRHGLQVICHHKLAPEQALTCVRLDKGWEAPVRVVWARRKGTGETEAGLEFLTDENFWGLESSGPRIPVHS